MKRFVAVALALCFCCVFASAEDGSPVGLWEIDKFVYRGESRPVSEDGYKTGMEFTAEGELIRHYVETWNYTCTDHTLEIFHYSLLETMFMVGEVGSTTSEAEYEIIGDMLILRDWYGEGAHELYRRLSGEGGLTGEWELVQMLDDERLEAFLNDPEGFAPDRDVNETGLLKTLSLKPDNSLDICYSFKLCEYTVSDGVIALTAEDAEDPLDLEYFFEDGELVLCVIDEADPDGSLRAYLKRVTEDVKPR